MEQDIGKHLKEVVWDYDIPEKTLLAILDGRERTFSLDQPRLRARLLSSTHWYALIDAFGVEGLRPLLSEDAIGFIHAPDIRRKFRWARAALYGKA